MTRGDSLVLTLAVSVGLVVFCGGMVELLDWLSPRIATAGPWVFSSVLAAVAAPFFYLMFRRMK